MNQKLKEKIRESLAAVLPITGIVLVLCSSIIPLEIGIVVMFFMGALMLVLGMGMFQLGAETAMEPLGEGIGATMARSNKLILVAFMTMVMGILVTIAEPDLQILSNQVPSIPNQVLIFTVAGGVGICLCMAVLRMVFHIRLSTILAVFYVGVLIFSFFVPDNFLAVAFDSGGVTTGPITVPFIMALGVGLSSGRGDKNASSDSFGLVALSSVGPILAVMILGCCFSPKDAAYEAVQIADVATMQDVIKAFAVQIPHYAKEVSVSLLPIILVFILFQLITKRYHTRQIKRIAVGFVYTYIGLVMFLCGVNIGFAPVGTMIGRLMGTSNEKWMLVFLGMLIGYFIVRAEPAIQILNRQVQSVTNGVISAKTMNWSLSVGVAFSLGLAVLRILLEIPIQWIIIPGYIIALILSRIVPPIFVGIAFDSGGVASGPMTSTFALPLCIGVCEAVGGNIMTEAFGVVALVALTPLIAIQMIGVRYKYKLKQQAKAMQEKAMQTTEEISEVADTIVQIEED